MLTFFIQIYCVNCQPLVPSISAEGGQWVVAKPFTPVCKPGGHGVIWKLAYDKGIFKWFYDHGRKGATVRQVRLAINSIFNAFKSIIYRQLQNFIVGKPDSGHYLDSGDLAVMLLLPRM